jgi:hypothetical protein
MFFSTTFNMADWANLFFQARLHAANEPGFLAIRHLELVTLNGGHVGFCLNLGLNLATPAGRDAANFHAALIIFCWELCQQGLGNIPYHPAPFNHGPMGPVAAGPVNGPAAGLPEEQGGVAPPEDDFVEIIGGVHPVHGPWVVDHDFVEIIGGVHPVHGPWVEVEPPAANMDFDFPAAEIDALANELWQQPNQEGVGEPPILDVDLDFDLNLLQ